MLTRVFVWTWFKLRVHAFN